MANTGKLERLFLLLAGCLMGFGLMAVFSIGLPILLLGMILALHSVKRTKGQGFWLALVGMSTLR